MRSIKYRVSKLEIKKPAIIEPQIFILWVHDLDVNETPNVWWMDRPEGRKTFASCEDARRYCEDLFSREPEKYYVIVTAHEVDFDGHGYV